MFGILGYYDSNELVFTGHSMFITLLIRPLTKGCTAKLNVNNSYH